MFYIFSWFVSVTDERSRVDIDGMVTRTVRSYLRPMIIVGIIVTVTFGLLLLRYECFKSF